MFIAIVQWQLESDKNKKF